MRIRGTWYLLILFIPSLIIGKDPIDKAISKNLNTIIDLRHQIHQYPELGNREYKTAKLVAEHLRSLGIEVETDIAYTGVVGVLKGNKPGPVVAVRADMDALPVTEETDLSFKSTVKTTYLDKEVGVMHACGHDIHTSVQLGVASVLASMKRSLPGTVKFIFQPAEEGPPPGEEGGADLMLKEGVFDNPKPSAVFGLHTHAALAVGELGLTIGPAMAAVDQFIITIKGKQSHGAYPHKSVDPIIIWQQKLSLLFKRSVRGHFHHWNRVWLPLELSAVVNDSTLYRKKYTWKERYGPTIKMYKIW